MLDVFYESRIMAEKAARKHDVEETQKYLTLAWQAMMRIRAGMMKRAELCTLQVMAHEYGRTVDKCNRAMMQEADQPFEKRTKYSRKPLHLIRRGL